MGSKTYHESAVVYNEVTAFVLSQLASGEEIDVDALAKLVKGKKVEDETVKGWCKAVSKQHDFHTGRHKAALANIEKGEEVAHADEVSPVEQEALDPDGVHLVKETNYRDARTGEYVTEEYAAENPEWTVSETDWQAARTDASPDASQAAEPVENVGATKNNGEEQE